jgi:hypothetical protein
MNFLLVTIDDEPESLVSIADNSAFAIDIDSLRFDPDRGLESSHAAVVLVVEWRNRLAVVARQQAGRAVVHPTVVVLGSLHTFRPADVRAIERAGLVFWPIPLGVWRGADFVDLDTEYWIGWLHRYFAALPSPEELRRQFDARFPGVYESKLRELTRDATRRRPMPHPESAVDTPWQMPGHEFALFLEAAQRAKLDWSTAQDDDDSP